MNSKIVLLIAVVCHQANKAWCEQNGDTSQKEEAKRCYALAKKFLGFVEQNIAEAHYDYAQENIETGAMYAVKGATK